MGRRSVNTTKSGKFMNPTDQARKEARKRELKKNKKQRMAVRHAVLKSKDPLQLLEETTLYDKQEYDPSVQAQLSERVIQEKRRKLLETFDRLVMLYRKEDAEYANRLQAARQDYDKRRHEMMLYYEQVKLAERVKASEIPLPKLPQSQMGLITSDIPLPPGGYAKGILKKSLGAPGLPPSILPAGRKPPGPPPGTPPELSDSEEEDNFADNTTKQRKIRFADADPMVSITPPLSQIPLPPPMALPSFTGLIRPGFPGAPQPTLSRFTYQRPTGPILSAPPSLHLRDPLDNAELVSGPAVASIPTNQPNPSGTTIEAKPQLKNLIGDATRFVPTALKVRRIVRDTNGRLVTTGGGTAAYGTGRINSGSATSKDDAYEEFMREMEGLI
ncbi:WW domain-binding protein 11 [Schistosoma bovis]|uniref:WW domain-binding protein 11 n=1 Tax=Schistosoma bovis TaxID=6184 RepID=A0A430QD53_SCHBO|nr:WW domain-binding protein 11 [Schistosoma bovis]